MSALSMTAVGLGSVGTALCMIGGFVHILKDEKTALKLLSPGSACLIVSTTISLFFTSAC